MMIAALAAVADYFISGGQYFWVVPFIALGDCVLIFLTWAIRKYKVYGVVIGAAGKFLFLYYVLGAWMLPWLVEADMMPMRAAQAVLSHAEYLQFVNALLGGILALILWHKFWKKRKR
jgi:predicted transporter